MTLPTQLKDPKLGRTAKKAHRVAYEDINRDRDKSAIFVFLPWASMAAEIFKVARNERV